MSAKQDWDDKAAAVLGVMCLSALALVLFGGAVLLVCMAYSTVDCTFNPTSERCIALDKSAWERVEDFNRGP